MRVGFYLGFLKNNFNKRMRDLSSEAEIKSFYCKGKEIEEAKFYWEVERK